MTTIKVLIVEDSKIMQEIITKILSSDSTIEVVGVADDPLVARSMIKNLNPDVITLDIMLPHMDGITFLKNIMHLHPMPVVMISNLTEKGSEIALEALAIGAVDYLIKPSQGEKNIQKFEKNLLSVIKNAAKANVKKNVLPPKAVDNKLKFMMEQTHLLRKEIIVIGASTGGIEAIETILLQLPQIFPPIVIVQHMRKEFAAAFPQRISQVYGLSAIEAQNQTELKPGFIYIAPAKYHLIIQEKNNHYYSLYDNSPPIKNHKPSIDLLFESVANVAGTHAIGVLLTGMGSDGAQGLKKIRDKGGITIVQDKESSIVWGMPGSAVKIDAADYVVSLNSIHQKILNIIDNKIFSQRSTYEDSRS